METEPIYNKNMFAQTILGKIFGTKERNPVKLEKTSKIDFLILLVFWQLLSKFNIWKEDWALVYFFMEM